MLIFLTAFFSLIPAFGQPAGARPAQPSEQKEEPTAAEHEEKTADVNAAVDPNTVRAKIEEFEGLGEALEQIDREGRNGIREWTRRTEDRLDLALAVQKQITAELNLLRGLAVEEGAVKTTAAIDGILLDRQERFKGVIEKLEKERERLRRRSEREDRGRERESSRERSRERPSRTR